MPATPRLDIAITDKNAHVREFLCRELADLGHRAWPLAGAQELLERLDGLRPPQVLVLDPEAIGPRMAEVADRLKGCADRLVVVLHVFPDADPQPDFGGALVVEKQSHMGALKAALGALAAQIQQLQEAAGKGGVDQMQERA